MSADAIPHALSLLLTALVLDMVLAWLPGLREILHAPFGGTARLAGWFDARLNRERRSAGTRFVRGLIVTLAIAAIAWEIGVLIGDLPRNSTERDAIEAATILFLLYQRGPFDRARRVARTMAEDDHGAARQAVEMLAVSLGAGVVGVTVWYLILGLPGLCLMRALHATAERIGRRGPFGRAAATIDAVLGFVPATLAGWLIALAALFAPRGRPIAALAAMIHERAKLPLWDAGGTTAAMAGALGFALGGGPWIGDGRARLVAQDVRSASYLYAVACLIHMGLLAGALAAYSPI